VVDNDGTNYLVVSTPNSSIAGVYHNVLNLADLSAGGSAKLKMFADTGAIEAARLSAVQSTGSGGKATLAVKQNGSVQRDLQTWDQDATIAFPVAASMLLIGKTAAGTATGVEIGDGGGRMNMIQSTAGARTFVTFRDASGVTGSISSSGAGVTTYATSSDKTLKTNFRSFEFNAQHVLRQTAPLSYNWKSSGEAGHGYIAQTIGRHYPPAAVKPTGRGAKRTPWMVDNSKMVPVLHAALLDVMDELKALKAEVKKLKSSMI